MKKGEKIIQIVTNGAGQIVALTNLGRMFAQEKKKTPISGATEDGYTLTHNFFLIDVAIIK